MIVVAVMNGQFAQVGEGEITRAAPAYPRVDFQCALTVAVAAGVRRLARLGDDAVEFVVVDLLHAEVPWVRVRMKGSRIALA